MHRRLALFVCLLLSLSLGGLGKSDKPDIKSTKFDDVPAGLFYFDDSDVVLVTDPSARTTYRSDDAGVTWKPLDGVDQGKVLEVLRHPYNNQVALVIGTDKEHWITRDQGKTWKMWTCPGMPTVARPAINFHASDPDRMLYMSAERNCLGLDCKEKVFYTTDGFESDPKLLKDDAVACMWAKSTDRFTTGLEELDQNRVLCIVKGAFNPFATDYRLLTSDDFFDTAGDEPAMSEGRTVQGVMNLAAVKSYIVAAARSEGTTELAMFVTNSTMTWHRAEFGEHKLEEDAYTILESTNYSMQVDVLTTRPHAPMGVLLTSNSNGTFFTKNIEHTNRNVRGYVDFEKIQNIQGILLVNTVDNWQEIEQNPFGDRKIKSQISFDDGRTWNGLKAGDGSDIHLHSVTDQRNVGRIFSSAAPGIVMGVGNKGDYLRSFEEGDLYVSDDAVLTWKRARDGPHLYEFGDQGSVLVAIEHGESDKIKWSLNHGVDWDDTELEDSVQPILLTTVPDSTSLKFILTAVKGRGSDRQFMIYSIDFSKLDLKTCKGDDFEKWSARVDDDGKPTCIMGHTQTFRRRKKDKKCFVDQEFIDPLPVAEDCKCTDEDYECDYENGFTHHDGKCTLTGQMKVPEGACKNGKDDEKFKGPSGYRLIPGNTCIKKGGIEKDQPIERDCKELNKPVASGKITNKATKFTGDGFVEYYYLEKGSNIKGQEETIVMRTDRKEVYVTHDHGKQWEQIYEKEEIVAVYPHQYNNDYVYLITPSKTVYYSVDRAATWHKFEAPEQPNLDHIQILSFHQDNQDWLIWTGSKDCTADGCETVAYVSVDRGDDWKTLLHSVRKCQYVYRKTRPESDKLIYCEQRDEADPNSNLVSLISSDDWFEHKKELKRDVINFATMAEYIVVAVRDPEQQSLQVDTSIDGEVFADAKFPYNFNVPHQQAYTVLDSSTHAVFLHVTVNNRLGQEYGSIIKSNSNGTSYVLSVGDVNRNSPGYVDFEKMQGLEGVAVINRVANVAEVDNGSSKKLKTYMTHNDGADWALIPRPKDKLTEKAYPCDGDVEKCSLHLHGYTERKDPRDTFSSSSAVGLMMATGNVGEFLGFKRDADTFITRDGGVNWNFAAPGNWMWEYGDQGSIIVIVKEDLPTMSVLYTLDEGQNWLQYVFSNQEVLVTDITTLPSDNSLNFMLWGKVNGDLVAINIDFSGLIERSTVCVLQERRPNNDDYELWSPSHPDSNGNCLFGHEAQYHRKKIDRQCSNGKNVEKLHGIKQNCSCTRTDFECDYNFQRMPDGTCTLVAGLEPKDPMDVCKADKSLMEYYKITGYRRIPLSTCEGGKDFELTAQSFPCPGHEPDYNKKHGLSSLGLFFAVVIPVAAAAAVGYYVWKFWGDKFGRIRLGDDLGVGRSIGGHGAFDRDAPWIKFPIMAISGVVAVVAAVPLLIGSLWGLVSTRLGRSRSGYSRPYTSRGSFARGRGDYAIVDEGEGELLGEDSDEDI